MCLTDAKKNLVLLPEKKEIREFNEFLLKIGLSK